MLVGIGRALVGGNAHIDPAVDEPVEIVLVYWLAALVEHVFGNQSLGQRCRRADGDGALEDHLETGRPCNLFQNYPASHQSR